MAKIETVEKDYSLPATLAKRISWGAIFAGVVVVLVTQLTLGVLGLGIGAGVVNLQDSEPEGGLGIAAIIWVMLSTLIALFLGGYVAGRLSGTTRKQDSCLHGVLTWSAQTLVALFFISSTISGLVGGLVGLLGQGISATSQGISRAVSQGDMGGVGSFVEEITGTDVNWDAIREDAKTLTAQATQAGTQTGDASAEQLQQALREMFDRDTKEASAEDREALINVVAGYTGMNRQQAEQRVNHWEQMYQQVFQSAQQTVKETRQDVTAVAGTAVEGISQVALWTFVTLILGACAAGWGGYVGRPKHLIAEPEPVV